MCMQGVWYYASMNERWSSTWFPCVKIMSCLLSYAIPTWLGWFHANLCIVIAWWEVHKIRSTKLCHVYTHYYLCTTLWWSCASWNPQLWNYELLILFMWSKVSSLVSFILLSPRDTCTDNLVVCLELCHIFTLSSVKPWSVKFSHSYDSGKLSKFSISPVSPRNLSNISSSVISMILVLSNLGNFSIPSKSY